MNFKEFIGNLGDFLKNQKSYLHFITIVSSFCGVSKRSVESWLDGTFFPKGITLLKFREVFANSVLYSFDDMKVLPRELRLFAKLIVHGTITVEDACKEIGFSSKDELLRPLTGFRFPGKERMEKIQNLIERCSESLNESSIAVYKHFSGFELVFRKIANLTETPISVPTHNKTTKSENLINALGGIKLLISASKSDIDALYNGSPEERQLFRDIIGTENLFHTTNDFFGFCKKIESLSSETAFGRRAQ